MSNMPNLDDFPALPESNGPVPVAKKGFDWKQSNGVKIGVAVGLVVLAVLIFGWQFGLFGGKAKTASNSPGATSAVPDNGQVPPPPPAPVAPPSGSNDTPPPTPPTPDNGGTPDATTTTTPDATATTPQPGTTNGAPGMPGGGYGPPGGGYGPPGGGYGPQGMTPPGSSDKPLLPDDVAKWKKDDYLRARRENHPKLPEAIFYSGKRKETAKSEKAAEVFVELLKPIKVEPNPNDPSGYAQPAMLASPQLIETIVTVLTENGTAPAQKALNGILAGEFSTDDDRAAVDAVMKNLAFHPSAENDALMLKLLTQPETVRNAAAMNSNPMNPQMSLSPSEMQTKAQELVKVSASEELRRKLAEHFAKGGFDPNDATLQFLLQEDPANLPAQLVLYHSEDLSADNKIKLEQYFLNYASLAIGLTTNVPSGVEGMSMGSAAGIAGASMGMPPGYGGGMPGYGAPPGYGGMPGRNERGFGPTAALTPDTAGEKMTDTQRGVKLASAMWSSPLVASLIEQLADVRSLEKSAPTVVLASAFPLDAVRAEMFRTLKKRHLDGPQFLDTAGWSDRVLNDPGTLVLVKMLNRREMKKGAGGRTQGYGAGYNPNPSGTTSKAEAAQKKLQAEYDWFEASRKLVGLWCNRCDAAAQAQRKAARKGTPLGEPAPKKLDDFEIPMDKDTKIEDSYQLSWPEKAPAGLAAAKPGLLKIQYFRLTQTGTIKKTMTSLKRGMKSSDLHETDKGLWAEIAPKATGPAGPRRSVDVLVTRADKSAYDSTQKEEPTDLEIHILAVEIADPGAAKE